MTSTEQDLFRYLHKKGYSNFSRFYHFFVALEFDDETSIELLTTLHQLLIGSGSNKRIMRYIPHLRGKAGNMLLGAHIRHERQVKTIRELADEFEISQKTVYTYLRQGTSHAQ